MLKRCIMGVQQLMSCFQCKALRQRPIKQCDYKPEIISWYKNEREIGDWFFFLGLIIAFFSFCCLVHHCAVASIFVWFYYDYILEDISLEVYLKKLFLVIMVCSFILKWVINNSGCVRIQIILRMWIFSCEL